MYSFQLLRVECVWPLECAGPPRHRGVRLLDRASDSSCHVDPSCLSPYYITAINRSPLTCVLSHTRPQIGREHRSSGRPGRLDEPRTGSYTYAVDSTLR